MVYGENEMPRMKTETNPLKLLHDYPNNSHVPDLTCWCNPKVLSGKHYAWAGYELFDEMVAVHK